MSIFKIFKKINDKREEVTDPVVNINGKDVPLAEVINGYEANCHNEIKDTDIVDVNGNKISIGELKKNHIALNEMKEKEEKEEKEKLEAKKKNEKEEEEKKEKEKAENEKKAAEEKAENEKKEKEKKEAEEKENAKKKKERETFFSDLENARLNEASGAPDAPYRTRKERAAEWAKKNAKK